MRVGFVGLGKMGRQIVDKLINDGHEVVVFDVSSAAIEECVKIGARSAANQQDLVDMLGENPIVWLMIPADYVEAEVESYIKILPKGGVLIDGGNSNYKDTIRRGVECQDNGISYVDVGTSGGVLGIKQGFCLMIGGDEQVCEQLNPIFDTMVKPQGRYSYMGPSGLGHYVKMIHNGIEYSLMQSYAEGYDLLKYGEIKGLDLAKISHVWQGGSIIESGLNSLIDEIFQENPKLENIEGYVADSGEGRWTYDTALAANVPMPALREALNVRQASQNGYHTFATKLLAAMRNKFGGHAINKQ